MGGTPFSVVAPQNYYECATFQMTTRTGQGNRRWGGWGHIQRNCCAGASTRAWFSTLNSLDSKGSSLASSSTSGLWKVTSEERTGLIKNSRGNNKNWNVEERILHEPTKMNTKFNQQPTSIYWKPVHRYPVSAPCTYSTIYCCWIPVFIPPYVYYEVESHRIRMRHGIVFFSGDRMESVSGGF